MELGGNLFEKFGVEFQPDEIIFAEYEPGDSCYFINSGEVKIVKIINDKEKTLDILKGGDFFGEMAILEEAPRSASAIAITVVKALKFKKEDFNVLIERNTALALKLLKVFVKRIYDAKRKLMILALKDPYIMVLDVLLMLSEAEGHDPKKAIPVSIKANDESIASWCGIKPKLAKTILDHYEKIGKLTIEGGLINISNINEIYRIVMNRRKSIYNE